MSTKTLRKRIALVAVAALGAGILSVAPANAAVTIEDLDGSVGLLAGPSAGTTTRTAVLLSTGTLVVNTDDASSYAVVSAGAVITSVDDPATTASFSTWADPAVAEDNTMSADQSQGISDVITIKPTGAVGSTFTVTLYTDYDDTIADEILTVTIAGSSVQGVAVAANSYVNWTSSMSTPATTETASNASTTVGTALELYIQLRDAYKANVTSTTGALVVTASAGAKIGIGGAGPTTTAVTNASPAALYVQVNEATVGAGWSGTLTVTYNGVVMATKSGKITGAPSAITITPKKVGKNDGSPTDAAFDYTVADPAGNALVLPFADLTFSSSSAPAVVSSAAGSVVNTTSAAGKGTITCVSGATGSSSVVVQTVLANGTVVKSNAATFLCGGAAASYTASFDKASYVQGEIAKLTVSFKDAKGAAANSIDTVTTWVSATDLGRTISTPQLTAVDSTPSASETVDVNGNKVYTFTVGTTPGSYNAVVSFPKQSSAANQTVAYKVTTGSTAVSNEDVLKAIVSLIASINKQIAALQKALLRR